MKIKTSFMSIAASLAILTPLAASSQSWMTNSLIAYYRFNGNAADGSGHGNDGTISNGIALAPDQFGKSGSAFSFDGVDDFIQLPSGLLNNLTQGTVVADIYLSSYPTNGAPIFEVGSEILTDFMIVVNPAGRVSSPWFDVTEPQYVTGNQTIPLNTWVQVALTWDGQYWKQYVNGRIDSQFESRACPRSSTATVKLGHHSHCCLPIYFHGRMDEVRLYSRALSLPEIEQLNLNQNLVAHYPLNGNLLDISHHANHGIAQGSVAYSALGANGMSGQFIPSGSGYVEIAHQPQHIFHDGFTVGFWFKPNLLASDGRLLQKLYPVNNNQGNGWDVICNADHAVRFYYASDPLFPYWSEAVCPIPVSIGNWHFIVYTYSAADNTFRGYLNGVAMTNQIPVRSPLPMDTTLSLMLMHDRRDSLDAEGWLDEVRIYNRAITSNEVRQLFAVDLGRPYSTAGRAARLDHQYLQVGTNYQLQISHDLNACANFGLPFAANSPVHTHYVDAESGAAYFRLVAQ